MSRQIVPKHKENYPPQDRDFRVLVADDNDAVRKVIVRLLNDDPEIELVGEASNFRQTMLLAKKLKPTVIILDLHLAGEKIAPSKIKSRLAGTRVLAICIWTDAETQALAGRYGALRLLNKANLAVELVSAIKQYGDDQAQSHSQNNLLDSPSSGRFSAD